MLPLCKYDWKNCDLFVLDWARVQRVCLGSVFCCVLGDGGICGDV